MKAKNVSYPLFKTKFPKIQSIILFWPSILKIRGKTSAPYIIPCTPTIKHSRACHMYVSQGLALGYIYFYGVAASSYA